MDVEISQYGTRCNAGVKSKGRDVVRVRSHAKPGSWLVCSLNPAYSPGSPFPASSLPSVAIRPWCCSHWGNSVSDFRPLPPLPPLTHTSTQTSPASLPSLSYSSLKPPPLSSSALLAPHTFTTPPCPQLFPLFYVDENPSIRAYTTMPHIPSLPTLYVLSLSRSTRSPRSALTRPCCSATLLPTWEKPPADVFCSTPSRARSRMASRRRVRAGCAPWSRQ
eukprot:141696-Chlamydomonas_euryale.AAC.2